jgi:hypothetical protein
MVFCRFLGIRMTVSDWTVAHVAQLVEHILGKDEVISSILIMGSSLCAELGGVRKLSR